MHITITKDFPIGIKDQIKRQIKMLIEDKVLEPGEMLLSAKELAADLNIHRNTVAAIYKELETQSLVKIIKGSGTFVCQTPGSKEKTDLKLIFKAAYEQALQSGYSPQNINDYFITGLLEKSKTRQKGKKAILIDSSYDTLKTLDRVIKEKLDIESHFMLIQDIQSLPGRFLKRAKNYDLIICNMDHIAELNTTAPDLKIETIGFLPASVPQGIYPDHLDFILSKLKKEL